VTEGKVTRLARISTRTLVVLLLVLGLTLGLLTAIGVYVTTTQAAAQRAQQVLAPVIAPIHPIAARTVIQATDVHVVQEHRSDVPAQAASTADQVVGKVALVALYTDAPILTPQVAAANTARSLGYALPQGLEAMALPTPDLVSGSGAIAPGDRIDIILTVPTRSAGAVANETQFALQEIAVIGVGQVVPTNVTSAAGPQAATQGSLTVLVTPQQALILTYAKESSGEGVSINLVLRRPDDTATYRTDPVSLDYLRQTLDKVHP
jgi:pilus assembly protein CpaB